jgi:hypothetical protein
VVLYTSLGRIAGIPDLCRYPSCASIVPDISYSIVAPVRAAFSYETHAQVNRFTQPDPWLRSSSASQNRGVLAGRLPDRREPTGARDALVKALDGADTAFVGLEGLNVRTPSWWANSYDRRNR